jgi:two-component system alkaline phosphatase synthesis response regulator PhoP
MKELIIKEMNLRGKETYTKEEVIDMLERYSQKPKIVESCGVVADMANRIVTHNNTTKNLPRKEFLLLYYLMDNKNKVMRRNDILNEVWGTEVIVVDRTIDVHIRKIRNRLPNIPLKTIKGVGYIWNEG